jgi:flavin reductase (DIM6/NTAB) family NADH-FMN oxidoreductase RutF
MPHTIATTISETALHDETHHFYEPDKGHRLPHDPFKAIVCPRPIGWISTCDPDGRPNIAPYSFFTAVSDAPPMIAFASDGWKDTARNAEATGEFAFNFVSRKLAGDMNKSSVMHEQGIDEFVEASIESRACRVIKAPCVAASPAVLECKVVHVLELNRLDGTRTAYKLVIGQVVGVQLDRHYLHDGRFDFAAAQPVMRAGYRGDYVQIAPDAVFEMIRPKNSYI